VGWKEGVVGSATVGIGRESQAGYTLEKRRPVIVQDLESEKRFSDPSLLLDHGVVSGISVPMIYGEDVYGVMGAHTKRHRDFTESDVNFLESIANIVTTGFARRRAEEELQRHAMQLEHSNKLKDLFTDIMRHDLQNPVAVIKGMLEVLKEEGVPKEVLEDLETIEKNAAKLLEMLEDASELAKLESTEKLGLGKRDLREILRTVVSNYEFHLKEREMKAVFEIGGECFAMVHPSIEDAFANLVSNAIKYGAEKTEITVGIKDAGEHWEVYVTDRGEGIRDEYKDEIFDRFKRKSKRGVKGTGLGLAIAKRIVELHKGKVWVEDNPEGGSIFYVKLPKKE
jgi:hypothetical protein